MTESAATWDLNLSRPPTIVGIGIGFLINAPAAYEMRDFCALHLYTHGGSLTWQGETRRFREGALSFTPSHGSVTYEHHEGVCRHIWVHMKLPGMHNAALGVYESGGVDRISEINRLSLDLQEALGYASTNPLLLQARIWDILLRYNRNGRESVLERLFTTVENSLHRELHLDTLAAEAGLSRDHLTRLVKGETGLTLVGYIRSRRIHRAAVLLQTSDLPIKQIAYEVGIPDLQHFNKSFRAERGLSPRAFRENSTTS